MNLNIVGGILGTVGQLANDLITTDKERAELLLEGQKQEIEAARIQTSVNVEEAKHSSVFVAGWRPAVGWTCVSGLAYQFVLYPLLMWLWAVAQAFGWIPKEITPPPLLETEALWVLLSGMLGIATMRTAEKVKGVARKNLQEQQQLNEGPPL